MPRVNTEDVKRRIREGILALAAEHGKSFVYSPTELAKVSGVSRPSLYKYADFIDEILNGVKAQRKLAKGMGVIEFMREKVDRVDEDKKKLTAELYVLRKHHIDLYQKLYYQSASLAEAIRPTLLAECVDDGKCILCKQEVDASTIKQKQNVIEIAKFKEQRLSTFSVARNNKLAAKTLIMTVGLPRSGKSTWAMQQGIPVVNPDSIRKSVFAEKLISNAENSVWAVAKVMVSALFEAGHDQVILDATSITKRSREVWVDKRWRRKFLLFDTPAAECVQRANKLNDTAIVPTIQMMSAQFEKPGDEYRPWEVEPVKEV